MDSDDLTASDPPTSIDPYSILSVPKDASAASIKSAYKKLALKTHPDKASPTDRDAAHVAFQQLALAYAVLSDDKRRARYDRTGSTAETLEDDDDFNWTDYFKAQYAEHVTADKIRELKKTYQGSEEERGDVLKAYKKGKGSLDVVFEMVMLSSVLDDEDRIRGYIDAAIEIGEAENFENYSQESQKKRDARKERARREAEEAEEAAEEMGIKDDVLGNDANEHSRNKSRKGPKKAKGGKTKDTNGSMNDLAALIQQRHASREANAESFFDSLEAKYGGGSKGKKRKVDEPSEEAFAAMAKRGKRGKETKVSGEGEDDLEASKPKSRRLTRKR